MAKSDSQIKVIMHGHHPVQVVMPWKLYMASLKGLEILDILLDNLADADFIAALHQRSEKVEEVESTVAEPWTDLLHEEILD